MIARRVASILALLMTTGGLTAVSVPEAQAVGCYGDYCTGTDPQSTGCAADGRTVASAGMFNLPAYVELRWSPTCKTQWARVPRSYWLGRDTLGVVQPNTGWSLGYSSMSSDFVWSKQIYTPKLCAYGWWEHRDSTGGWWGRAQTACW